jgi:hypothetical protein
VKPINEMNLAECLEEVEMLYSSQSYGDPKRLANRIHDLTRWTDADIDASYIMGCINAHSIPLSGFETFPTLVATQKELERLKRIGFNTPSDAIRAIRYPQRITPPEGV